MQNFAVLFAFNPNKLMNKQWSCRRCDTHCKEYCKFTCMVSASHFLILLALDPRIIIIKRKTDSTRPDPYVMSPDNLEFVSKTRCQTKLLLNSLQIAIAQN